MPTLERPPRTSPRLIPLAVRVTGIILLVVLLFAATLNNWRLYALFGRFWHEAFLAVGWAHHTPAILQTNGAIGQLTHNARDIPSVLTYSALYICTCLALLFLILPYASQRKLVVTSYGLTGVLAILLLLVGKLGSADFTLFSSQLIHFIVSPMPVIVLAPLLWWYMPKGRPA